MNVVIIACRDPNCEHCPSISSSRLTLTNYFYTNWNGDPLPLVAVPLAQGGYRFMGTKELEQLPVADRIKYQKRLPDEFDKGFQRYNLCYFFSDKLAHLMRHVNGAHPGKKVTDCFPRPYTCLHQPPRPLGASGLPVGPPQPRCLESFSSKSKLDDHKLIHSPKKNHFGKRKRAQRKLLPLLWKMSPLSRTRMK